jgi:hypothetical protein
MPHAPASVDREFICSLIWEVQGDGLAFEIADPGAHMIILLYLFHLFKGVSLLLVSFLNRLFPGLHYNSHGPSVILLLGPLP